jgi:hypothetical protein
MSRVEVLSGPGRRRGWSAEQKRSIVRWSYRWGPLQGDRMLKLLLVFAVNILTIVAIFIGFEVYFRVREPSYSSIYFWPDRELGWVLRPNVSVKFDTNDKSGTPYTVDFRTDRHGFREWGNVYSSRRKILFVGDSFTADPNASNDETYFGRIKHLLDVEVFAAGGGGYGTLQELLLIKRFVKQIKPDLFVLQFCSNDFGNNSMELEESMIVRSQSYYRPYMVDGEIKYRNALIYRFLFKNSFFFRALDGKFTGFQYAYYGNKYGPDLPDYRTKLDNAERITLILLQKMAALFPSSTKLATFNCDTQADITNRWIRVATAAGYVTWPTVSKEVEKAEGQGEVVRAADSGHWNPRGHCIAALQLEKDIVSLLEQVRPLATTLEKIPAGRCDHAPS